MQKKQPDIKPAMGKVFAITSGKGGVGKSSIAVNLSIALSQVGLKVLLIDADMGLANIDIMTGVSATNSIEDVIEGRASIFEALADGPENLTILPAASGLGRIQEDEVRIRVFRKELLKLENAFDFIFIDTGAGISANVVEFVFMAREIAVIMTPEPTAFADAYAMVKVVSMERPDIDVGVIINVVNSEGEARKIYEKFNEIVKRFLGKTVRYRGCVLRDKAVGEAVLRQVPLALYSPKSAAMRSLKNVARIMLGLKEINKKGLFSR